MYEPLALNNARVLQDFPHNEYKLINYPMVMWLVMNNSGRHASITKGHISVSSHLQRF